jgi:hypothetical protein
MILEFIKRRYDAEIEKITNLDGKANNLIGFVEILIKPLLYLKTINLTIETFYSMMSLS